jgi:UDP-N-acetylmuramoyl-tripeptide--D-alanyl-D-alanine ligase
MFSLDEIVSVTRGEYLTPKRGGEVSRLSIDSRTLFSGDLFVAFAGGRFDGHDFIDAAIARGAAGAIVRRSWWGEREEGLKERLSSACLIGCDDPLVGLQRIAAWHRRRLGPIVVGITGSNGKTTTKEMAAAILSRRFTVLKSEGNLNNHIGLPLSLLRLTPRHKVAVVEMGINHPGEMELLCSIARPDLGLITNIGEAHLEFFGDRSGVAKAKGALFEAVSEKGCALINLDDPLLAPWAMKPGRKVTFGEAESAELRVSEIKGDANGMSFTLRFEGGKRVAVHLSSFGAHQVKNAAAAAAVGRGMGLLEGEGMALSEEEIRAGLAAFRPVSMRSQVISLGNFTILLDAYNANPDSMKAALSALPYFRSRRVVAVLADMLELGGNSERAHREVGSELVRAGVSVLITVGERARWIAEGAAQAGLSNDKIDSFVDLKEAADRLSEVARRGDLILIKGSRAMKLEQLLDRFVEKRGETTS